MKNLFFLIFVFLLIPLYSDLNIDQLENKTNGITVEVMGIEKPKGWFGGETTTFYIQGFFLNEQGYVLTIKSFFKDLEDIKIEWVDTKGYSHINDAIFIEEHPTQDVVILKVDSPQVSNFPSGTILYKHLNPGSYVFVSYTEIIENEKYPIIGKILDIIKHNSIHNAMISIPTIIGGIGAPIFDTNGFIIGIHEAVYFKKEFICCLPIVYLQDWINDVIGK